jgi:hypothetical protein
VRRTVGLNALEKRKDDLPGKVIEPRFLSCPAPCLGYRINLQEINYRIANIL